MIDLLSQYCTHCDYPCWRANLAKHRDKFNKVILYPNEYYRDLDLKAFAKEVLKETWVENHVIDWTTPGIDWRQAEVIPMLELSNSEWVYFNEQDWFVKDYDRFYESIFKAMRYGADAIGWLNPTHFPYLHPSCFFVKRELLNKTQLDFRAHTEINGCDHFAMITKDLKKLGAKIVTLQELGFNCDVSPDADCFHLGGLTSNYVDSYNPNFQFHRPEIFSVYNSLSQTAPVVQSGKYLTLSSAIEKELVERNFWSNPEESNWRKFFI